VLPWQQLQKHVRLRFSFTLSSLINLFTKKKKNLLQVATFITAKSAKQNKILARNGSASPPARRADESDNCRDKEA